MRVGQARPVRFETRLKNKNLAFDFRLRLVIQSNGTTLTYAFRKTQSMSDF